VGHPFAVGADDMEVLVGHGERSLGSNVRLKAGSDGGKEILIVRMANRYELRHREGAETFVRIQAFDFVRIA